jgi:hypothetical protein
MKKVTTVILSLGIIETGNLCIASLEGSRGECKGFCLATY